MSKAVSKVESFNKKLLTTLVIALGVSVSACSGGHEEEVLAIDRVEQAADIARQLAPEAENMKFPKVVATPMPDAPATDMAAPTDGAEVAATDAPATNEDLAVNVGAELYNNQCMACHATGLLGSPKYGDAAAWAPRIPKGIDTLAMHSAKGFNQMPAQATNGVTEVQIRAAVEYMVAAAS